MALDSLDHGMWCMYADGSFEVFSSCVTFDHFFPAFVELTQLCFFMRRLKNLQIIPCSAAADRQSQTGTFWW